MQQAFKNVTRYYVVPLKLWMVFRVPFHLITRHLHAVSITCPCQQQTRLLTTFFFSFCERLSRHSGERYSDIWSRRHIISKHWPPTSGFFYLLPTRQNQLSCWVVLELNFLQNWWKVEPRFCLLNFNVVTIWPFICRNYWCSWARKSHCGILTFDLWEKFFFSSVSVIKTRA